MPADAIPAISLRALLSIFFALLFAFIIYLVFVSNWYWNCAAQFDTASLTPVTCPLPSEVAKSPPAGPDAADSTALWPAFGKYNDVYEGLGTFWGDDVISRLFDSAATGILSLFTHERGVAIATVWNDTMKPLDNRKAVAALTWLILTTLIGLVLKDIYKHMTAAKPA